MNTTREQRAEAYANKYTLPIEEQELLRRNMKHAHIAGAQEEAAIKDARILELESIVASRGRKIDDLTKAFDIAARANFAAITALESRIERLRKALWMYGGAATWDPEKKYNRSIASEALAADDKTKEMSK